MTIKCSNCRYIGTTDHLADPHPYTYTCLRYPPSVHGPMWPLVLDDEWCGEWKALERP